MEQLSYCILQSVNQTTDGGYMAFGYGLDRSISLVKTNSIGEVIREKRIDSTISSTDYAFDIKQTSDNGLIVTG